MNKGIRIVVILGLLISLYSLQAASSFRFDDGDDDIVDYNQNYGRKISHKHHKHSPKEGHSRHVHFAVGADEIERTIGRGEPRAKKDITDTRRKYGVMAAGALLLTLLTENKEASGFLGKLLKSFGKSMDPLNDGVKAATEHLFGKAVDAFETPSREDLDEQQQAVRNADLLFQNASHSEEKGNARKVQLKELRKMYDLEEKYFIAKLKACDEEYKKLQSEFKEKLRTTSNKDLLASQFRAMVQSLHDERTAYLQQLDRTHANIKQFKDKHPSIERAFEKRHSGHKAIKKLAADFLGDAADEVIGRDGVLGGAASELRGLARDPKTRKAVKIARLFQALNEDEDAE